MGGRQAALGEQIGQVQEDRHLLGNHRLAILQRRHLAQRVQRAEGGRRVLPPATVEHL